MKVLAVGQYDGEFKRESGETIKYSKVMLTVSENGRYPRLISVDMEVYQNSGGKLAGKEVEIEYIQRYGKMKPNKIVILN